jgi:transcriptional regulator GlxA family with amidase domain
MSENATRTLGAVLYPDFELLDLFGPLEMFGSVGSALRIVTVAETLGPVASAQGPQTLAEFDYASCPALDLILVPGGIGTFPQLANPALLGFLKERSETAELTLSVCSGSALLAKAGVLDGRRATSNKQFFSAAASQSDAVDWVTHARWVEDGPVATSSGVSAGMDMALAVIERIYGAEMAETISVLTEYTRHTDASQDPFAAYLDQGNVAELAERLGRD